MVLESAREIQMVSKPVVQQNKQRQWWRILNGWQAIVVRLPIEQIILRSLLGGATVK